MREKAKKFAEKVRVPTSNSDGGGDVMKELVTGGPGEPNGGGAIEYMESKT